MKKTVSKCLLMVLMAAPLPACQFSFTTARIADASLSKGINDKSEPVNKTTDFSGDDPVIHCVVQLANAPSDTKVRARWVGVKAEGLKENELLAETDIDAGSSKNIIDFTLKPAEGGLPPGDYKVDLYIDPVAGKESPPDKSLSFNVKASGPSVSNISLSTSPDGDPPSTSFSPDTQEIHCRALLRGAVAGTKMGAAWVMEDVEGQQSNDEITRSRLVVLKGGENVFSSSLKLRNGLAPGRYRVDVYMNNLEKPAWSQSFLVRAD